MENCIFIYGSKSQIADAGCSSVDEMLLKISASNDLFTPEDEIFFFTKYLHLRDRRRFSRIRWGLLLNNLDYSD